MLSVCRGQRVTVGVELQNVLKARPARLEVVLWELVCPLLTILEAAADVGKRERDANGSKFAKGFELGRVGTNRKIKMQIGFSSRCEYVYHGISRTNGEVTALRLRTRTRTTRSPPLLAGELVWLGLQRKIRKLHIAAIN